MSSRSQEPIYADPPPSLSRTERHALIEEAYDAYSQLFAAIRIARAGSDPHTTALGGVSEKTTGTLMMCTTTTIYGTLEEVAELYTASESHYILDFAESKRLYELESPTKENPMRCVGLRYSRWASFTGLVTDRDILYLEVMDEFVDKKTGRRGWARCTKSVPHRSCPPSQHPKGPLRAELYVMGHVVRETSTIGVLELITLVHADIKKHAPSWIAKIFLKARKKNAQKLSHVLKVKRHVRDGSSNGSGAGGSEMGDFTGRSNASSEDETRDRRACKGCMDHISRWSRSYKCRRCNDLICKSCATMTYVDTDTKVLQNRICAECSFTSTETDDEGSVDLNMVEETMGSNRERERSDHSRRGRRKQRKHKDEQGEVRERIFSHLSTEEPTIPKEEAVESPTGVDETRSTMHQLELLNSSMIKSIKRKELKEETHAEPPTLQRHVSGGTRMQSPGLQRQQSGGAWMQSPGLQRQQSGGIRLESPCLQRQTSAGHSNHRTNSRVPYRSVDRNPLQAPESTAAAANAVPPFVQRPKAYSTPVPKAEPAAMVDLSYLQSFAMPKATAT